MSILATTVAIIATAAAFIASVGQTAAESWESSDNIKAPNGAFDTIYDGFPSLERKNAGEFMYKWRNDAVPPEFVANSTHLKAVIEQRVHERALIVDSTTERSGPGQISAGSFLRQASSAAGKRLFETASKPFKRLMYKILLTIAVQKEQIAEYIALGYVWRCSSTSIRTSRLRTRRDGWDADWLNQQISTDDMKTSLVSCQSGLSVSDCPYGWAYWRNVASDIIGAFRLTIAISSTSRHEFHYQICW